MSVSIVFVDEQTFRPMTEAEFGRIEQTLVKIAADHGFEKGEISVAVLDDDSIQQYNRKYLEHDYPTDVISFLLSEEEDVLDGQLLISRQTADFVASELPWDGDVELLLYAIHGTLHLVGYDDDNEEDLAFMRAQERSYLMQAGVAEGEKHPHFAERSKLEQDTDEG